MKKKERIHNYSWLNKAPNLNVLHVLLDVFFLLLLVRFLIKTHQSRIRQHKDNTLCSKGGKTKMLKCNKSLSWKHNKVGSSRTVLLLWKAQ